MMPNSVAGVAFPTPGAPIAIKIATFMASMAIFPHIPAPIIIAAKDYHVRRRGRTDNDRAAAVIAVNVSDTSGQQ